MKPPALLCLRPVIALLLVVCVSACGDDDGAALDAHVPSLDARVSLDAHADLDAQEHDASQALTDASADAMHLTTDASADARSDGNTSLTPDASVNTCRNGFVDGDETDIDCGGSCGVCLSGRHCETASDCLSQDCVDNTCACLPLSACPARACGVVRHCGGELDCGSCDEGVCYQNLCCMPRTCEPDECGVRSDGCGGSLRCGDETCCTPRACDHPSLANRCGAFDDRCGGTVTCSCADENATCFLGECCQPEVCDEDDPCGTPMADGCGGTRTCGCAEGQRCHQQQCCAPLDCTSFTGPGCDTISDGCGGTLDCGCDNGESCIENTCCTPQACGARGPGDSCGNVDNGCGGTIQCTCDNGLSCIGGSCCMPTDCAGLGRSHQCGPASSCGQNLWCGCSAEEGMRVSQRNACGSTCEATLAQVDTCTSNAARETLNQTAGWSFPTSFSSSICNGSYGFTPSFTDCHNGFHLDAQGFIELGAGTHCFSITGNRWGSCGSLFFVSNAAAFTGWDTMPDNTAALVVSGDAPACVTLSIGGYFPLRWTYSQTGGLADFHVNYCTGADSSTCSPIPSAMLHPTLP